MVYGDTAFPGDGTPRSPTVAAALVEHPSVEVFLLGVHPEAGLTTADADEAAVKRLLSRRAVAGVITDADVELPAAVLHAS